MGMITFEELERRTANATAKSDLVTGVIPAVGVTLLCADAYAGKTTLMAAISACVRLGHSFAGLETAQGNVAWVYQDRGSAGLAVHLRKALSGAPSDASLMWVWDIKDGQWYIEDEPKISELLAFLDSHDVRLLVIDNLRRVTLADESRSAEMNGVFMVFHRLAAERRAVVVLHHSTKKGDAVRGSGDIRASADSTIFLTGHGENRNDVRLTVENHYGATQKLRIVREIADDHLTYAAGALAGSGPTNDALAEKIYRALDPGGKANTSELKRELGVGKEKLNRALEQLKTAGRIREDRGARGAREFSLVLTGSERVGDTSGQVLPSNLSESADKGGTPPIPPSPRVGPGSSASPKGGEADETGPLGTATGAETGQDGSGQVGSESGDGGGERCGAQTSAPAPALSPASPLATLGPDARVAELVKVVMSLLADTGAATLEHWREYPPSPMTPEIADVISSCVAFDIDGRALFSIDEVAAAVAAHDGEVLDGYDDDIACMALCAIREKITGAEILAPEDSGHVS